MSKQIKKKTLIIGSTVMLLFLGVGVWSSNITSLPNNGLVTEEKSKGVTVKKMSAGTNEQGQAYVTYSYTITPDYTTNKNIVVKSLAFTDGSVEDTPSNYVTVSIDNNASTFTVVQLADFSKQLSLTLASQSDESVTAVITIDCKQKWLGYTANTEYTFYNSSNNSTRDSTDNQLLNLSNQGYSEVYTIAINQLRPSVDSRTTVAAYECYSNSLTSDFVTTENDILTTSNEELTIFKSYAEKYAEGGQFSFNDAMILKTNVNNKWSDEKKLNIMNYKYYGFCIEEDVTLTLYNQKKTVRVKTFLAYYVSSFSLSINPTSLTVEQNQIIF